MTEKKFRLMTNNAAMVYGGNFNNGNIAGAYAEGDDVGLMNVSSNAVTITGGTNIRDVCGGRTINGTVSSNTVTINGGKIGHVFGGYVAGNGQAINNTITITGTPEFSSATILCGGIASGDALTGNRLRI